MIYFSSESNIKKAESLSVTLFLYIIQDMQEAPAKVQVRSVCRFHRLRAVFRDLFPSCLTEGPAVVELQKHSPLFPALRYNVLLHYIHDADAASHQQNQGTSYTLP